MTEAGTRDFESMARQWQGPLRRMCAGYERSEAAREELFQEILLALWRSLPAFRGDSSVRTWVFRVAHNVAGSHVGRSAREGRSREVPAEWVHGGAGVSPEETAGERESVEILNELIRGLKPLDRQIILLHLEEVPQGEIARIVGLSRENVSTRVHRIRTALVEGMNRRSAR